MTVARLPRPINWHFARDALAREVPDAYESGTISRGMIYAPRRKGKTEFILRDLIPLAQRRGWVAVYADLWDDKDQAAPCARRRHEGGGPGVPSLKHPAAGLDCAGKPAESRR